MATGPGVDTPLGPSSPQDERGIPPGIC